MVMEGHTMHGRKDFSMKGGDPLTGFIYTSSLAQVFASRVVRSAGPVGSCGNRHDLVAFPWETAVFRKNRCGRVDCCQHN